MNVTRLFLLRHGEVDERYHRVFGGRIDMDLSPFGHDQARLLAGYLRRTHVDAIYSSPMKRAQQTLAPLASHSRQAPVTLDGLREVDFGDWTGHGWEAVKQRFGVSAYDWLLQIHEGRIPNGEDGSGFRARVEPCVRQILTAHAGESVAVVCHGGVIRMILAIIFDFPLPQTAVFEIEYASLTEVQFASHKTEIHRLNFTPWRDLK